MNTKKSRVLPVFLISMLLVLCLSVPALAANVNTAYPSNITGYIQSTNNKTARAYSSINGTAVGYIYSTDDAKISAVYTNGWCCCTIPWSGYKNGRTVYTPVSNFFAGMGTTVMTATVKSPAYSRSNLATRLGYCYVGDRCIILATSGNYYQCLCPWSSGSYRLCWIAKSAFATVVSSGSSTSSASFTVLNQNNYASIDYSKPSGTKATVKSGGCCVVALANAIRYFSPHKYYNDVDLVSCIAARNKLNGARVEGGSRSLYMVKDTVLQSQYGFTFCGTVKKAYFKNYFSNNRAIIIGVSNTCFINYSGTHIVALVGYNSSTDEVLCLDSNIIKNHKYAQGNVPFWIPLSKLDCDTGNVIQFK